MLEKDLNEKIISLRKSGEIAQTISSLEELKTKYKLSSETNLLLSFYYLINDNESKIIEINKKDLKKTTQLSNQLAKYKLLKTFLNPNLLFESEIQLVKDKLVDLEKKLQNCKLSICIIAKDEEEYIEKCLISVKNIAFEIIVVDTGSTDKTIEISKKYADVYKMKWENDFAKARNNSISYAKGDWVLFLDASEVLVSDTKDKLLDFLQKKTDKPYVFAIKIVNPSKQGKLPVEYFRKAIFKNNYGFKFIGKIHEQITTKNMILEYTPQFSVYNLGNLISDEKFLEKANKYIKTLKELIKNELEESKKGYYYFYLGNVYNNKSSKDYYYKSIKIIEDNISKDSLPEHDKTYFYALLLFNTAKSIIKHNYEYKEGITLLDKLIKLSPKFPEANFLKAKCYQQLGNEIKAVNLYKKILNDIENTNIDELNPLHIQSHGKEIQKYINTELGKHFYFNKEPKKGLEILKKTLDEQESLPINLFYLETICLLENNLEEAIKYHLKNKSYKHTKLELEEIRTYNSLKPDSIAYLEAIIVLLVKALLSKENTPLEKEKINFKINELKTKVKNASLSICIITNNSEDSITETIIRAKKVSSDVFIYDKNSQDDTLKKTGSHKVIHEKMEDWKYYKKCFKTAKNSWLLFLESGQSLETNIDKLKEILSEKDQSNNLVLELKIIDLKNSFYQYQPKIYYTKIKKDHKQVIEKLKTSSVLDYSKLITPIEKLNYKNNLKKENIKNRLKKDLQDKSSDELYFELGNIYFNLNKFDKAIETYYKAYFLIQKAIKPDQNLYLKIIIKAIHTLVIRNKTYIEARALIKEFIKMNSNVADIYYYKGICEFNLKNINESIKSFETAKNLLINTNENLNIELIDKNVLKELINFEHGKCLITDNKPEEGLSFIKQAYNSNIINKKNIFIYLSMYYAVRSNLRMAYYYFFENNPNKKQKESLLKIIVLGEKNINFKILLFKTLINIKFFQKWPKNIINEINNSLLKINKEINLPLISFCIITENNEDTIEYCLKSILPIAYEVIVIDLDSTDKTKDKIKRYTKVHKKPDFEELKDIRNMANDKCNGEWVFHIKPNELFEMKNHNLLLEFLQKKPKKEAIVFNTKIKYKNKPVTFEKRLFSNNYNFKFENKEISIKSDKNTELIDLNFLELNEI